MRIARFSENWGYLCTSPIIASSFFAHALGGTDAMYTSKECYVFVLTAVLESGCVFCGGAELVAALRDLGTIRDGGGEIQKGIWVG
jgi:hypothetical protein